MLRLIDVMERILEFDNLIGQFRDTPRVSESESEHTTLSIQSHSSTDFGMCFLLHVFAQC